MQTKKHCVLLPKNEKHCLNEAVPSSKQPSAQVSVQQLKVRIFATAG